MYPGPALSPNPSRTMIHRWAASRRRPRRRPQDHMRRPSQTVRYVVSRFLRCTLLSNIAVENAAAIGSDIHAAIDSWIPEHPRWIAILMPVVVDPHPVCAPVVGPEDLSRQSPVEDPAQIHRRIRASRLGHPEAYRVRPDRHTQFRKTGP